MDSRPQRIVMLVQNGVVGDSRIQKEAESAAAAGWEVVLLGCAPKQRSEEWELGGARVRLLPVRHVFDRRRHEIRRGWLRGPLAYPPGPLLSYRRRQLKAWEADLAFASSAARGDLGGKLALRLRRAGVAFAKSWIERRCEATEKLRSSRQSASDAIDRMSASFWKRALGDRAWRRLDPALWDLELAFGPVIDKLRPDLIHANDFQMLGVGARAKVRAAAAGRDVKLVWDAHEFLPGMKPWKDHPWWHAAQEAHEREYAPYADAVVTVSDTVAALLRERHGLSETPEVVMNVPEVRDVESAEAPEPGLRKRCGIDAEAPLMVYSGAPLEQRGLRILVEALPSLPAVHAAFVVSKPHWSYVKRLEQRAEELGVRERVHVLPYVPHWQVVRLLTEADMGVIPLHHWGNHEISLITKFFEYSHAHLPIVVSDVKTMADMVRRTGQGEVFRSGDVEDLVRAVEQVLDDPERYRKAYDGQVPLEEWTWQSQAERLAAVYEGLIGRPHEREASVR